MKIILSEQTDGYNERLSEIQTKIFITKASKTIFIMDICSFDEIDFGRMKKLVFAYGPIER